MKIIEILLLSIASGLLMYFGGEGHKQIKRIGVPLIVLLTIWRLDMDMQWYLWLLCAGLLYLSMTTYFSEIHKPKDDVAPLEWAITGFFYGIVLLPYAISSGYWLGFGIRTIVLSLLIWFVSVKFGNVFVESFLRGFIIIITILLL